MASIGVLVFVVFLVKALVFDGEVLWFALVLAAIPAAFFLIPVPFIVLSRD